MIRDYVIPSPFVDKGGAYGRWYTDWWLSEKPNPGFIPDKDSFISRFNDNIRSNLVLRTISTPIGYGRTQLINRVCYIYGLSDYTDTNVPLITELDPFEPFPFDPNEYNSSNIYVTRDFAGDNSFKAILITTGQIRSQWFSNKKNVFNVRPVLNFKNNTPIKIINGQYYLG